MPKHHKFQWKDKIVNLKELADILGVAKWQLQNVVNKNNCKTTEDVLAHIGEDKKHLKRTIHVGDKFNHWIILDAIPVMRETHLYYHVKCDCGKTETWKTTKDLERIDGCNKCQGIRHSIHLNIGDRYGNWTVVDNPITRNGYVYYPVMCDCGTIQYKRPGTIIKPDAQWCIHCSREKRRKEIIKKNGAVGDLRINKVWKIKKGAIARNLEYNVSMEYLWDLYNKQNRKCAITGDDIPDIHNASLDRIDSSKGYVEGNVQWTTNIANICKYTLTMPELIEFCKKVINHANQQPSQPLTKLEGSETNS